MDAESSEQHLEEMSPDAGIVRARVLLGQIHVLQSKSIQTDGLAAEQSWVLQQGFGTHDSVNVGLGETMGDVTKPVDATIGHHWNGQGLFYSADDFPVAAAHSVLVLLLGAPVDSQKTAAGLSNALGQRHGLLLVLENPDFAEYRHFDVLDQRFHDLLDEFRLFEQVGAVVTLAGDALGTAQIDVDGIHFSLQHLGSLHHRVRVVAADLGDQGTVLGTGGEVLLLVVLGGSHHLGVQHGSVAEIGAVATGEETEGEFGLLDHGGADEERVGEEGQLLGGGLLLLRLG